MYTYNISLVDETQYLMSMKWSVPSIQWTDIFIASTLNQNWSPTPAQTETSSLMNWQFELISAQYYVVRKYRDKTKLFLRIKTEN